MIMDKRALVHMRRDAQRRHQEGLLLLKHSYGVYHIVQKLGMRTRTVLYCLATM
jgi:hypothetical protein